MSTFVLKRSYELQLPTSFVDVDRAEMEYVDGGFAVSVKFAAAAINTIIGIATTGFGSVGAFVLAVGRAEAKKIFTRNAAKSTICVGIGTIFGSYWLDKVVDFAVNYFDPGTIAANWLDSIDTYGTNGWIG